MDCRAALVWLSRAPATAREAVLRATKGKVGASSRRAQRRLGWAQAGLALHRNGKNTASRIEALGQQGGVWH